MVNGFTVGEGFVISLIACVFMLTFMYAVRAFDKKLRASFLFIVVVLIVAIIFDQVDSYLALLPSPVFMRFICKLSLVTAEGLIMLEVIYIMSPDMTKENRYLLSLPFFLVFAINCTAPFGQHVIYFTRDNQYKHGPFGALTFSQVVIYFAVFIYIAIKKYNEGNTSSCFVLMMVIAMNVVSTILETTGKFGKPIIGTITVSVVFVYVFLYSDYYSYDSITHCLKRRCFYNDCVKNSKSEMAIVSMDLNDLKYLNDQYGHFAGDEALRKFADVCRTVVDNKRYKLYRTGGDEFMILGFKVTAEETLALVNGIRANLQETGLSFSVGVGMYEAGDSIEEVIRQADQAMYYDKANYKKVRRQHRFNADFGVSASDQ